MRRITLHGMLLQALFWFGMCTHLAFLVVMLIDHGWSASFTTGMITVMSLIVIIVQPIYGYISDKYLSEKKMSVILLSAMIVFLGIFPFALGTGNNMIIISNMVGITLSGMHVAGLLDSWIVGLNQEFPSVHYGTIRGAGSLSFAVSAQISGMITVTFGHDVRLWFGTVFLILTAIVAATFRSTRRANVNNDIAVSVSHDADEVETLTGMEAFKIIFSSKQYCLLLAVSFCLLVSFSTMPTLLQIMIPDLGGTAAQIGTAIAVMAGSEAPFMFLMAIILKKFGIKKLLVFCSAAFVVRMLLTASMTSVNGLIAIQAMQGITLAILLPLSMSYLSQIVDERVRSTAITTFGAITVSLTGIVANLVVTAMLGLGFTAQHVIVVFAFTSFIGFLLVVYGWVRKIWI